MPFRSKRQWRAAFAGRIPGISKEEAREWAHETESFKNLPDRAPTQKGKPTLLSKSASSLLSPRTAYVIRKLREQLAEDREGRKQASEEFVAFCAKLAFSIPKPGQIMSNAQHVGSFTGKATQNFLKPPGSTLTSVTNPRLSLRNAMTKSMRP